MNFQSTDDAFIAARQTALAQKVSGYITAVPASDDEHVATGDVITRIDDRDYRIRRRRHKSRPRKPASRISTRAECAASTDQRPTLRANARSIARAFGKTSLTANGHLKPGSERLPATLADVEEGQ
jgi:membrane fusion protein (multidrug efflux system)